MNSLDNLDKQSVVVMLCKKQWEKLWMGRTFGYMGWSVIWVH